MKKVCLLIFVSLFLFGCEKREDRLVMVTEASFAPFEYYSDAYRVAENIVLDHIWFGPHPEEDDICTRIQDFFAGQDMNDLRVYKLDGTPEDEPAMHPTAIRAVLGAASVCSRSQHRLSFLRLFVSTPLRKGSRRYYDNCLYFFCLLMLTGNYRIYC